MSLLIKIVNNQSIGASVYLDRILSVEFCHIISVAYLC